MKKEMALPAGKAPAKRRYLPAYLSYQWRLVRKYRQLYVLMLPFVIIFTLFTILPVLLSVVLSLTSYNVLETPKFVGWDNYIRLFMYDDVFPTAVRNTFAFALVTGPASYVLCFFFAWIINDMTPRVRTRRPAGLLQKKGRWGYLFIMPFLIGFVFIFANSLYSTIRFAFSTVTPGMNDVTTTFVGWENFRRAFLVDEKFPQLLVSSIVSMLTDVPVLLVFSFFCAVLLHQKFRGNGLVKSIFFLTVILSSGVFQQMTVDTAAANQFGLTGEMETGGMQMLQSMQLERYLTDIGISEGLIEFIVGPIDRLFVVMSSSGIQIFVFLAGLGAIPPSLYESCSVEGASGWETFWKITFPMVSPLILVNTVYTVIDSFMASNNELLTFIYGQGFSDMQFGYASALSWIYFLVVAVFLAIVTALFSGRVFYHT